MLNIYIICPQPIGKEILPHTLSFHHPVRNGCCPLPLLILPSHFTALCKANEPSGSPTYMSRVFAQVLDNSFI